MNEIKGQSEEIKGQSEENWSSVKEVCSVYVYKCEDHTGSDYNGICFLCGRAGVTPYVWCAYAHLTSFRGEEGKQRLLVQLEC